MAYSELPWRPFLGHQAWSWTTLRRGNVFLRLQTFFFIFVTFLRFLNVFKFLFERFLHLWIKANQTLNRCTVVSATSKYDEPQVENVARGRHFQPRVIIFRCRTNDHASPVLPYDQLQAYNIIFSYFFNFYQQFGERSCVRSTPFATWCCNIRRLHSNNLKCKFLL